MRKIIMLTAFAIPAFLISCGGNQNEETSESTAPKADTTTASPKADTTTVKSNVPVSNTVEITANDQMKFSVTEIRVKAGQKVKLTLKNIGKMPITGMGHDFVLLAKGTDVTDFGTKVIKAKPGEIPAELKSFVLAETKLLGPGQSDTIEFTVPAGEYDYICSFPGHYGSMRGKLWAE